MANQLERHDIDDTLYVFLQDNSKRWYARFQLFGKWYCKATKQKELEEAKATARYLRTEYKIKIETGTLSTSKRFRDVAKKAIEQMEHELAMGTGKVAYKDYIGALTKYHIPVFDRTYITSIDQDKLREFNVKRREIAKKDLSKSTILNHNAALNMVFKIALDNQWMAPIQVPNLNNLGKAGTRRASFTPEEYQRICDKVIEMEKNARKEVTAQIRSCLFYYMEFAINTGLRPGSELDQLTWGDLHIQTQNHMARFYLTVRKGKTTKFTGTREVVCNANIYDAIWGLTRDFPDRKPSDLIFRLKNGKTTKELGRTFTAVLDELGIKESHHGTRTLYSLRHSYITWELMAQRVSMEILAKQCGTSISMIEQHYSHVIPKMFGNQLSGIEMDEIKQVKDRFALSTERAVASYTKRAKEWEANYRRRGCI
ncbi:MAG: site-specific integrase [Pseudomonadota bacterium]